MMQTNDPMGLTLLRITGVWMMLFGIVGVLLYLAALGILLGVGYVTDGIFAGTADIVGVSLLLAGALAELISGILGRKAVRQPQKVRRCIPWGVITLVLSLAGLIHILLRGGNPLYWVSLLLAAVTPVAYLVGARKLIRACASDHPAEKDPRLYD